MLSQDAHSFSKAVSELWLTETICDRSADLPLDDQQVLDTRQNVLNLLQYIRVITDTPSLSTRIHPEISRFEYAVANEPLRNLAHRCDHLRERILDELSHLSYLRISREDAQYYGQREPFGDKVATKFSASRADIAQAANCLALHQSTACVFHLMRGMEAAVRRLANKLGMPITHQTTWRQITGNMDARIQILPHSTKREKDRKDAWMSARINLHHLGSVLRNNTMHPSASYTQEEARHIFDLTGITMKNLCNL